MPVNHAQAELYTTVVNISGGDKFFGFVGPHGARLAADEVYPVPGDIRSVLAAEAMRGSRKKFNALEASVKAGLIEIRSTPLPIMYDATADGSKTFSLDDDVLGLVDPTYTAEESSAAVVAPV